MNYNYLDILAQLAATDSTVYKCKYLAVCLHHKCSLFCKSGPRPVPAPPTPPTKGNSLNICSPLLLGEQLCSLLSHLYDNITVAGGAWGHKSNWVPRHTLVECKSSLFYTAELQQTRTAPWPENQPRPHHVPKQTRILKCFVRLCMRHELIFCPQNTKWMTNGKMCIVWIYCTAPILRRINNVCLVAL